MDLNDYIDEDWFDESKPTFLFKINVGGLSRQRMDQDMANIMDRYKTNNANLIFIPIGANGGAGESDVECIHGGSSKVESVFMERLIENVLKLDDEIIKEVESMKSLSDEQISELKQLLRRRKLKTLLGGD